MKKGISLIVLVITIIVIIILAGAVIVNLTSESTNTIAKANEAKMESERANIQANVTLRLVNAMTESDNAKVDVRVDNTIVAGTPASVVDTSVVTVTFYKKNSETGAYETPADGVAGTIGTNQEVLFTEDEIKSLLAYGTLTIDSTGKLVLTVA